MASQQETMKCALNDIYEWLLNARTFFVYKFLKIALVKGSKAYFSKEGDTASCKELLKIYIMKRVYTS